jgi:hypothetical protein
MMIGDLVYVRKCILPSGKIVSAIGIVKGISIMSNLEYEVFFPEFGYAISFTEDEIILLEEYHGYTER